MTRRQGGPSRPNSHLVTFRVGAAYGRGGERLEIRPGTRLVGTLSDGAEPVLDLPAMSLGLSREIAEIAPHTDPKLTLRFLAQQSEREAREALADLRELLIEWLRDDTTYQAAQTKKVYRAPVGRFLDWLESQGELLIPAALTTELVKKYPAKIEPAAKGKARNSISVWCDWLVQRGVLTKNPVVRGE